MRIILPIFIFASVGMLFSSELFAQTPQPNIFENPTPQVNELAKNISTFTNNLATYITDTGITTYLNTKISQDQALAANHLAIQTQSGIVIMAGNVVSEKDAGAIIQLATSILGVKDVNTSHLTIASGAPIPPDLVLTAKVRGRLARDKFYGSNGLPNITNIGVESKNGVVYLYGNVETNNQAQALITSVQGVPGVISVQSKVQITSAQR